DCSPDGTEAAAWAAAGDDRRVKIITLAANQGPSGARNAGLAQAKGEWIAVLDADDRMAPGRLEKLLAHARAVNADVVGDALALVNQSLPLRRHVGLTAPELVDLAGFARDNEMFGRGRQTGYLKPMFRAAFLQDHALVYDPSVRVGEDYML